MNNGNTNYNNKNNTNNVRAVSEFHRKTINTMITLESLFEAYWDCRKNKGGTHSAAQFEANYEMNLIELHGEIVRHDYRPGRSIAFIITQPVKREIFAASFRDRIIHHWIALRIEPLLEAVFIDETFNCRKGKGNHAGIAHLHSTIQECSQNYTKDCWVMRVDLQGFFMSIDRQRLCDKLCRFIEEERYDGDDLGELIYLTKAIMLNAPEDHCVIKGHLDEWSDLPANKSLFTTPKGFGLPIGNLTSQLTANFLLNDTDHLLRDTLGLRMTRYVDDICIVDSDKSKLLAALPEIRKCLEETAGAKLHPRKFYFQHYTKGIKFIGAVIKRERIYISNRTVSNAFKRIHYFNQMAGNNNYIEKNAEKFAQSLNSYLGIMKHYSTYSIRQKLISKIDKCWFKVMDVAEDYSKVIVKKKYKHKERIKYILQKQRQYADKYHGFSDYRRDTARTDGKHFHNNFLGQSYIPCPP